MINPEVAPEIIETESFGFECLLNLVNPSITCTLLLSCKLFW